MGVWLVLYAGDDWAEDHHDVALVDAAGRRLARARLPEGVAGIARFHELIAEHAGEGEGPGRVMVGIETDRGPWVTALVASGYQVYAINPMSVARYRERRSVSGAKSDAGDAWLLADLVRTDASRHRPVAGDSPDAEGIKVLARAHQRLIWERNRSVLRLRSTLREYFPAALAAFADLAAPDTLELLARAPSPQAAARLSRAQITAALKRAGRRRVQLRTEDITAALRAPQLSQPAELTAAYAAAVTSLTQVIAAFSEQIGMLEQQVGASFRRHAAAGIYLSQPGLGDVLAARVLGEFGDDPHRYASAKSRKNYASTSPITKASGKRAAVLARYARNDRLADAIHRWAFASLRASPGARGYYDELRGRGKTHSAALRQLGNRLVGILHGCLKTGTCYNEHTAWGHHPRLPAPAAA
jgi:Transposase/Transposase IS116/IS110/IS902 family